MTTEKSTVAKSYLKKNTRGLLEITGDYRIGQKNTEG
jgi:hypothetical protein